MVYKKLKKYFLIGAFYLAATFLGRAYADDFSKGARGPTSWQLDERVIYSENEKDVETAANNMVLKYWDGDRFGKWGFISLPYQFIGSPTGSDNGMGDISLGVGPRGRLDDLHWFLYGASTLPTGESGIGKERYDIKAGVLATYFIRKFELDGILEHNFTGENNSGVNPPNETYSGLLCGYKVTGRIKVGMGITNLSKENGDSLQNLRMGIRHTVSPKLHFEIITDAGVGNKNIPKGKSIGLYTRYNF